MSKREQFSRPLAADERRVYTSLSVPGVTPKGLHRNLVAEVEGYVQGLVEGLEKQGYGVIYGPKVIENLVTEDGADRVDVTAFAILRKYAKGGITAERGGLSFPASPTRSELAGDQNGAELLVPMHQMPRLGRIAPQPRGLTGDWAKPRPIGEALDFRPHGRLNEEAQDAAAEVKALFEDYVFRAAEQKNEALREIAEKMLLDGTMGIVMIQVDGPQDFTAGHETNSYSLFSYTKWALHPWVPFGHIFEFTSEESFLAWLERGPEQ